MFAQCGSGLSVVFWYHALQHAVLIYNLLSVARGENDEKLNCTVWDYHFGTKPVLQKILLGPFGCLAYLVLSEDVHAQTVANTHHVEDFMLSHEGEEISHAQIFESCWAEAKKAKVAQTQAENKANPKG